MILVRALLGSLVVSAIGCASPIGSRVPAPVHPAADEIRFSLLAVGDTGRLSRLGRYWSKQRSVGLALEAEDRRRPADALVLLGDNFYWNGLQRFELVERVRENLVRPYCRFVDLSGPRSTEVRDACREPELDRHPVPIYALLGNHDYVDPESPGLQRREIPEFVANWRMPAGLVELVEFPVGVSLVLIDSVALRAGSDPEPLRAALRRSRGPWRILAAHHPIGHARDKRRAALEAQEAYRALVQAIVREAGVPVHLAVAGDEHNLQMIEMTPAAPPLQVVAGSGSRVRELDTSNPRARFALESLGFARIDLVGAPGGERLLVSLFATAAPPAPGSGAPRLVARWTVDRELRARDAPPVSPVPVRAAARDPGVSPPPLDDQTVASLRAYQDALLDARGGDHRFVALEEKARHFEWLLWRYHVTPARQISPRVRLPEAPGQGVAYACGADDATWNGALLAALSYRYGVTRDPETLERIGDHLEGLHLFLEATGQPGLPARCVIENETPFAKAIHPYQAPDGTRYFYRAEPAKGTYNQLVLGYATLMMLAYPELPEPAKRRAREDLAALVLHVIRHGYRITNLDGTKSRYGGLRPMRFGYRVPFNAQVAYMIVAAGHHFPPHHAEQRALIAREFRALRRRHVYYAAPWLPPFFHPQGLGRSRFLDANDRNHLANAAFIGLALELHAADREGRAPDAEFLGRLGATLRSSTDALARQKNSLANFMWAAILRDPDALDAIAPKRRDRLLAQRGKLLDVGVQQLRRFPLDRLRWAGRETKARAAQWMDEYRPDSYYWKAEPRLAWEVTGSPTDLLTAAIDYLHAYWLFRHYGLDGEASVLERHGAVLKSGESAEPLRVGVRVGVRPGAR